MSEITFYSATMHMTWKIGGFSMVASINSTNLLNLYSFNSANKTYSQIGAKVEDNSEVLMNDFFKLCVDNDVDTIAEYNKQEAAYCNANQIERSAFNFNDYLKSRGCKSPDELKILDSINVATKKDLINYVTNTISNNLTELDYSSNPLSSDEMNLLLSKTDLQDLADFYSATNEANSDKYSETESKLKNGVAFENLIDKFSKIDNLDDNLKTKLKDISQRLEKNIKNLEEVLQKEAEEAMNKTETINNSETDTDKNAVSDSNDSTYDKNIQKYNAALIANYQSM